MHTKCKKRKKHNDSKNVGSIKINVNSVLISIHRSIQSIHTHTTTFINKHTETFHRYFVILNIEYMKGTWSILPNHKCLLFFLATAGPYFYSYLT